MKLQLHDYKKKDVTSIDEILRCRGLREIPLFDFPPGVYILLRKGVPVYVGQSVNPVSRIANHASTKKRTEAPKDFDRAYLIPCHLEDLKWLEGALIRKLNPEYNWTTAGIKRSFLTAGGDPAKDEAVINRYLIQDTPLASGDLRGLLS